MVSEKDAELPPEIARMWALSEPEPPRRGPRPALSVAAITAAAIELADAEGLGALSMARIAERLGFTTMSLYRYVSSKDELLTLLMDAASGMEPPPPPADGWRASLRQWGVRQIELLLAHPWMLQLPIVGPPVGPNALRWVDAGVAALADCGLEPWEKMSVIGLVASYGLSEARLTADQGGDPVPFGHYLTLLVDPEQLPALGELVASGQLEQTPEVDERGIDASTYFGLERILDGVQMLIDSRQPKRRRR
jgi:AcrR family transcriptional regulator